MNETTADVAPGSPELPLALRESPGGTLAPSPRGGATLPVRSELVIVKRKRSGAALLKDEHPNPCAAAEESPNAGQSWISAPRIPEPPRLTCAITCSKCGRPKNEKRFRWGWNDDGSARFYPTCDTCRHRKRRRP